jgi:hypothetical protein
MLPVSTSVRIQDSGFRTLEAGGRTADFAWQVSGVSGRVMGTDCWQDVAEEQRKNSFLKERSGNVIENKGPPWKTWERCGNVYENKGSCPL